MCVEYTSTDRYILNGKADAASIHTLLAFRKSMPRTERALTNHSDLASKETIIRWIEDVGRRRGPE